MDRGWKRGLLVWILQQLEQASTHKEVMGWDSSSLVALAVYIFLFLKDLCG